MYVKQGGAQPLGGGVKGNAVNFIRNIIHNRPWEPKATTLRRLAEAYVLTKNVPASRVTRKDVQEIIDAIDELNYRGELKIVAGIGWKSGNVEFIFQAVV
jgi:hypothetical protein